MKIARNKPLFLELLSFQCKWPFCGNWNGRSLPRISPFLREADVFMLSHAVWRRLILKHSDTKLNKIKHSRSEFRGGRTCCAPLWTRHCFRSHFAWSKHSYPFSLFSRLSISLGPTIIQTCLIITQVPSYPS